MSTTKTMYPPLEYHTERTVTEKLAQTMSLMSHDWEELTPYYQGGRDWIVVGVRPDTRPAKDPKVTVIP